MVRVSRKFRCPVCESDSWCVVAADGSVCICMRTPSDKPVDCHGAGQGWLHRLTGNPAPPPPPVRQRTPQDAPGAVEQYMDIPTGDRRPIVALAANLGVSVASLDRLGCKWSTYRRAAAFPMRNEDGEIIGVRLRSNDGRKWAITGSHAALFIPDGEVPDQLTELWITEGPTDCAALLDLDVYAVGRPSCSGGVDMILTMTAGRDVVIMADADEPKTRPDGSTWRPGKEGAEALAKAMRGKAASIKIVYPLQHKDVRAWLNSGLTPAVLRVIEKNTKGWRNERQANTKPEAMSGIATRGPSRLVRGQGTETRTG